jgi:hypothetical protein
MANDPTQKLADGTVVTITRDAKLMHTPQETSLGDRMLLQYEAGDKEDVIIIGKGGKPRVKRIGLRLGSAALEHSLEDVDSETERRLLAIYEMFPVQPTPPKEASGTR